MSDPLIRALLGRRAYAPAPQALALTMLAIAASRPAASPSVKPAANQPLPRWNGAANTGGEAGERERLAARPGTLTVTAAGGSSSFFVGAAASPGPLPPGGSPLGGPRRADRERPGGEPPGLGVV